MNYDNSRSRWKPGRWVRIDLILTMRNIYINSNLNPLIQFTSSNRNIEPKDIPPWNIPQMIMKIIPISMRIVISYAMKRGIARWTWWKVNGNWNNIIRIFEWRESHCRKIILPEERNKSKRAGLWQLQSGIRAGTLTIWVRLSEIWKTVTATISIGSTKIGCKSLWLTLKSPKAH